MTSFLAALKRRKLVQWSLGYAAAAWLMLEVLEYVASTFGWPVLILRIATVVAGFGLLATVVLAWYHGEQGRQRVSLPEALLVAALFSLAVLAVVRVQAGHVSTGPGSAETESAALESAAQLPGPRNAVAVLPFDNLSADPTDEVFTAGFHDELLAKLSKIAGLRVISRTSVMEYQGQPENLPQIAARLGAGTVVEGSVRWAGEAVRITVQLIDASTDQHLWTEDYDRRVTLENLLDIQAEVAQSVAQALSVELSDAERGLIRSRPTRDLEAYRHYIRGVQNLRLLTESSLQAAIDDFNAAIEVDPLYAAPYAGIGESYFWLGHGYGNLRIADAIPAARAGAMRALELDENLAEAHTVLGHVMWEYDFDWDGAGRALRRALELDPSSAIAHSIFGFYLLHMGDLDGAERELQAAHELAPLSPNYHVDLMVVARSRGDHELAIELGQSSLQLYPGLPLAKERLARTYFYVGRYAEAVELLASIENPSHRHLGALGFAYARAGREEDALGVLARLEEASASGYLWPLAPAFIHAGLGNDAEALGWLERAFDDRLTQMVWVGGWPEFEALRDHPRFRALMDRIGLPGRATQR
jgi:TolB-like protein/Tfp pilus assembly protein PilF